MLEHRDSIELRIDGIHHDLSDIAVVHTEPLPGGLPFSLLLRGEIARRFLASPSAARSGQPSKLQLEIFLSRLRRVTSNRGPWFPRFSVATIEHIEVGQDKLRLVGTCSLILIDAFTSLSQRSNTESGRPGLRLRLQGLGQDNQAFLGEGARA